LGGGTYTVIPTIAVVFLLLGFAKPQFDDYSAALSHQEPRLDLASHPKARRYRTVLRESVKHGVNFAGHYVLATWGCGTGCLEIGVVNTDTGRVMFPNEVSPVFFPWFPDRDDVMNNYELSFQPTSRLLVVTGIPAGMRNVRTYYFEWNTNKFVLLHHQTDKKP
jgi:hypothetical protein